MIKHSRVLPLVAAVVMAVLAPCFAAAGENPYEGLPEVKWRLSNSQAPDHFMQRAYENFAAYVAEKSGGKFTMDVFHSSMLGNEQEVIENMQMGTIAGTFGAASLVANFVPCYNLFAIPALIQDERQLDAIMKDPAIIGRMNEVCEGVGLLNYGYFQTFFRQLFTKTPIKSIDDLTGQKIRVMGSRPIIDTWQKLGCNPTTTAFPELYSALQLGVCDGLDHVAASIQGNAFHENLGYVSEPKLFTSPMFVLFSKPLYDRLPEPYQQLVDEAVEKALLPELLRDGDKANADAMEFLTTEGKLTYVECDPKLFQDAVMDVRDKHIGELEPWVQDIARQIIASSK